MNLSARVTSSPAAKNLPRLQADRPFWSAVVAVILVFVIGISKESLWIDEGFTAWLVAHRSFASLVATLINPYTSPDDRQYPLYLIWVWMWCRVFGASELALRAANLPSVAAYVLVLALTCRTVLAKRFAWVPFAFIPFVWYYASEARPYMMLTGFATIAVGGVVVYVFGERQFRGAAIWFIAIGSLLALLSHVLGVFVLPGLALMLMAARRDRTALRRSEWRVPLLVCCPLFCVAFAYYAFTLAAPDYGHEMRRTLPTILYGAQVLYEIAGFDGLGPPRNAIRTGFSQADVLYAPWILFGAVLVTGAVIGSVRNSPDRRSWLLFFGWLTAFAMALAISFLTNDRIYGRHIAAAFPFLVFALMLQVRLRLPLLLLATAFLISDFRLTLLPDYGKDDYRAAVRDIIARETSLPGNIDWAADAATANYYGLGLAYPSNPLFAQFMRAGFHQDALGTLGINLDPDAVEALLREQLSHGHPVYLGLSKPDIYDRKLGWQLAIKQHHATQVATYQAFAIFVFR